MPDPVPPKNQIKINKLFKQINNLIKKLNFPSNNLPPSEWVNWKPCRQSHDSDSFRTTSNTESTSSAPKMGIIKKYIKNLNYTFY